MFRRDLLKLRDKTVCENKTKESQTPGRLGASGTNGGHESTVVSDGIRLKTSHFKTKINPKSFEEETQPKPKQAANCDIRKRRRRRSRQAFSLRGYTRLYDDPALE